MTDCELNKVLAEVAGVVTWEDSAPRFTAVPGRLLCQPGVGRHTGIWNPLTDHNQMALVKAGLRKQGWYYSQQYWHNTKFYEAWLSREVRGYPMPSNGLGLSSRHFCIGQSTVSELRAFAEAVRDIRENNYDQTNR